MERSFEVSHLARPVVSWWSVRRTCWKARPSSHRRRSRPSVIAVLGACKLSSSIRRVFAVFLGRFSLSCRAFYRQNFFLVDAAEEYCYWLTCCTVCTSFSSAMTCCRSAFRRSSRHLPSFSLICRSFFVFNGASWSC